MIERLLEPGLQFLLREAQHFRWRWHRGIIGCKEGTVVSVSAKDDMVRKGIEDTVEMVTDKPNGLIRVNRFQVWGWVLGNSEL